MTNHLLIIPRSLQQAKEENVMHLTGWGGKIAMESPGKTEKKSGTGKEIR